MHIEGNSAFVCDIPVRRGRDSSNIVGQPAGEISVQWCMLCVHLFFACVLFTLLSYDILKIGITNWRFGSLMLAGPADDIDPTGMNKTYQVYRAVGVVAHAVQLYLFWHK